MRTTISLLPFTWWCLFWRRLEMRGAGAVRRAILLPSRSWLVKFCRYGLLLPYPPCRVVPVTEIERSSYDASYFSCQVSLRVHPVTVFELLCGWGFSLSLCSARALVVATPHCSHETIRLYGACLTPVYMFVGLMPVTVRCSSCCYCGDVALHYC